ncbi:9229_t:CDS:1 [Ambispora gerdemannii]|uniref:9229_t:CDS:1 n=1 Tax=Ambispora gerdemannii TaxID=144530 RepID=A0A9N9FUU3_9GLOM|nr:9229_t:CDS:1 [Ambispora gerdemannii]
MLSFFSQFSPLPLLDEKKQYDKYTSNVETSSSSSSEPALNLIDKSSSLHLYRLPTFSYSPRRIKRQQARHGEKSGTITASSFSSSSTNFSISSDSHSSEVDLPSSSSIYYDDERILSSTPPSFTAHNKDPLEYVSFPSLEESHLDVKQKNICELEMESYDEMLVGGIRI